MKNTSKRLFIALSVVSILTESLGAPVAQAAARRDDTTVVSPAQKPETSLPTILRRILKPLGDILLPKG